MYKNPIFGDNIPQKTIKSHTDIIFFQNSLKYSKYASISPTIFFQKIHPTLPVSPSSCYGSVENYWGIDCALLPNREWNQKQKPKKHPWCKVDSPRKRAIHFAPRMKTARRFTAKTP